MFMCHSSTGFVSSPVLQRALVSFSYPPSQTLCTLRAPAGETGGHCFRGVGYIEPQPRRCHDQGQGFGHQPAGTTATSHAEPGPSSRYLRPGFHRCESGGSSQQLDPRDQEGANGAGHPRYPVRLPHLFKISPSLKRVPDFNI